MESARQRAPKWPALVDNTSHTLSHSDAGPVQLQGRGPWEPTAGVPRLHPRHLLLVPWILCHNKSCRGRDCRPTPECTVSHQSWGWSRGRFPLSLRPPARPGGDGMDMVSPPQDPTLPKSNTYIQTPAPANSIAQRAAPGSSDQNTADSDRGPRQRRRRLAGVPAGWTQAGLKP